MCKITMLINKYRIFFYFINCFWNFLHVKYCNYLIFFVILQLNVCQKSLNNLKTNNSLFNSKNAPPNIYQWIEENAYICTTVQSNQNAAIYFTVEEGKNCKLCPEYQNGEIPKVACAFKVNTTKAVCHSLPELCTKELENRYKEFFEAGGRIPQIESKKTKFDENIFEFVADFTDVNSLKLENLTSDSVNNFTTNSILELNNSTLDFNNIDNFTFKIFTPEFTTNFTASSTKNITKLLNLELDISTKKLSNVFSTSNNINNFSLTTFTPNITQNFMNISNKNLNNSNLAVISDIVESQNLTSNTFLQKTTTISTIVSTTNSLKDQSTTNSKIDFLTKNFAESFVSQTTIQKSSTNSLIFLNENDKKIKTDLFVKALPMSKKKFTIEIDEKNEMDVEIKRKTCRDTHKLCCFWAVSGECNINPFWMRINCAKTCGTCNCKIQNAINCISTGIQCERTTIASTIAATTKIPTVKLKTESLTLLTTTLLSNTKLSLKTTSKRSRERLKLPGFKKKLRRPQPFESSRMRIISGGNPPGHRPQRPTLAIEKTTPKTFTSIFTTLSTFKWSSTSQQTILNHETCFNYHNLCNFWSELGECKTNPFWMKSHCQKACNSCNKTIFDIVIVNNRPGCENQNILCPFWSFIGECSRNARWMIENCQASCQLC